MNVNGLVFQFFRLPKTPKVQGKVAAWRVRRKFPGECLVFTADRNFTLYRLVDVRELLALNYFSKMKYVAEKRDCDDYAKVLNGLMTPLLPNAAFGIVWMDVLKPDGELDYKHAANCFIDEKNQLWLVEPQSNLIYSYIPRRHKPYMVVI